MQIFYLSNQCTIVLCFILWGFFQVSISLLCLRIPDGYLPPGAFLFKERRWEKKGALYERVFKIRKWKVFLPDGGNVIKGAYRKKHLVDSSKENLERFVIETCRGELAHLLSIVPFWIFGLFSPPIVIVYMFIYAVAVNLPCIITQRYNRIRLARVINKSYWALWSFFFTI